LQPVPTGPVMSLAQSQPRPYWPCDVPGPIAVPSLLAL